MSYFYQVKQPRDELNYLKLVEELNNQLEAKYDDAFFTKNNMQKRYENIFKPITNPLHKSLQLQHYVQENHLQMKT